MIQIKAIFTSCIVFLFFVIMPVSVNAQIIFTDDFNDGNADDWTVPRNTCSSNWQLSNNAYGILINGGCVTESIPNLLTIPSSKNYSFDVDIYMPQSTSMDRNFVFKYINSSNWYGIHTIGNQILLHKVVNGNEYFLDNWQTQYSFEPNQSYHFRVDVIDNKYYVYINQALQTIVIDQIPFLNNLTAGLQASAGGQPTSEVWFDNVVVTLLPDTTPSPSPTVEPTITASPSPSPSPSPVPTASPSPSPTVEPTPILPLLIVPNLKQYSLPWKNKIYDHTKSTIQEFGCALTSAAMVLEYHGHNILPDGLNNWLNQQKDGYLANGLVNWLAVSRYTKLHDSTNSPTLEYKRLSPTTENLDYELYNNRPTILKENGHFVVATGKTNTTYTINDPGYTSRNTLEPYNNSFLAINSYRPTHSDLSYMIFVTDTDINLDLETASGSAVPIESYIEEPINSILNNGRKSGEPIKITLYEKPKSDKYNLKLTGSSGRYELDSYLYDINGNVTQNTIEGKLKGNDTDIFNITFENRKKINDKNKKSNFKFWFKHFFKFFKDKN